MYISHFLRIQTSSQTEGHDYIESFERIMLKFIRKLNLLKKKIIGITANSYLLTARDFNIMILIIMTMIILLFVIEEDDHNNDHDNDDDDCFVLCWFNWSLVLWFIAIEHGVTNPTIEPHIYDIFS